MNHKVIYLIEKYNINLVDLTKDVFNIAKHDIRSINGESLRTRINQWFDRLQLQEVLNRLCNFSARQSRDAAKKAVVEFRLIKAQLQA